LVEKIPHSRRYRLLPNGYRICLVFLKLFERIYAPLTAVAYSGLFPHTNTFSSTVSLNWIISTRRLPTLSTFFSMPSASKPLDYVRNENKKSSFHYE
jgi:hypothetical protein